MKRPVAMFAATVCETQQWYQIFSRRGMFFTSRLRGNGLIHYAACTNHEESIITKVADERRLALNAMDRMALRKVARRVNAATAV